MGRGTKQSRVQPAASPEPNRPAGLTPLVNGREIGCPRFDGLARTFRCPRRLGRTDGDAKHLSHGVSRMTPTGVARQTLEGEAASVKDEPSPRAGRSRHPRRVALLLAVALLAAAVPASAAGAQRLCREPLDISGNPSVQLPELVRAVKESDAVAYPAHIALAQMLQDARCAPGAVGVQWGKAAWHARSDAELDRTIVGLRLATERSGPSADLADLLCPKAFKPQDPHDAQFLEALDAAGIACGVDPRRPSHA